MEKGLIHLYYGDGKGKTTAAVGLAVRAYGKGKKVLFVQFLKDNQSGEIISLEKFDNNFLVLKGKPVKKFLMSMNTKEKEETIEEMNKLLDNSINKATIEGYDVIIFDELIDTINLNIIDIDKVLEFIGSKPQKLEIVITGHNPSAIFFEICDYVTEIKKIKHPYDKGIKARDGIEK